MNEPVFVAGTGIISAIGNNTAACLDALEHGRAGMGEMQVLHSVHRQRLPVAEVKLSNEELATIAGLPSIKSRTAFLSKVAATEALANAGIENLLDKKYHTHLDWGNLPRPGRNINVTIEFVF